MICLCFVDLRFLSVDFLNTFLLTYRVFTDGETVLEALRRVFYAEADPGGAILGEGATSDGGEGADGNSQPSELRAPSPSATTSRKASGASSVSGKISLLLFFLNYIFFVWFKMRNIKLFITAKTNVHILNEKKYYTKILMEFHVQKICGLY